MMPTNLDRVRRADPEELVRVLTEMIDKYVCPLKNKDGSDMTTDCANAILEWLGEASDGCAAKPYNALQDRTKYLPVQLDPSGYCPTRAHKTDAGLDLKTPIACRVPARSLLKVDTGVHIAIPDGYWGLVISKSGLMANGITSRGVIDSSYRGTIQVVLYNHSDEDKLFSAGDKISQLIILPCVTPEPYMVSTLDDTERGAGGFGSTGR